MLSVLIIALAVAFILQIPPSPLSADAAAERFSAGRAKPHVAAIAAEPRPIGSEAQAKAISYIRDTLRGLNLEVEEQLTTAVRTQNRPYARSARVRNLVCRIPGSDPTGALLLMAHHDSVPNAPGAGDAGAGVATLLETARALTQLPPLKNDVILLFTDGEEAGLFGAKAFAEQHPLAGDVALVLNFEGRGVSGPVMLFETSARNGQLIREAAAATDNLFSTSLMFEVYEHMPNDTDLTVFKERGYPSLNFAFIGGGTRYHSAMDAPANLSARTLQHMGDNALALTQHFGDADLTRLDGANATYFNPAGYTFLHFPESWVLPLTIGLVVLFILVAVAGIVSGRISTGGVLAALIMFGVLGAAMVAPLVYFLPDMVDYYGVHVLHKNHRYLAALVFLELAVVAVGVALFARYLSPLNLVVSGQVFFAAGALVAAIAAPGAAYFFWWPMAFNLVALMALLAVKDENFMTPWRAVPLALLGVPALLLVAPTIFQFVTAMTFRRMDVAAALVFVTILLLMPQLFIVIRRYPWRFPLATAALGLALIGLLHVQRAPTETYPEFDHVLYAKSADSDEHQWLSMDDEMSPWLEQFFGEGATQKRAREFFPGSNRTFWTSDAPPTDIAPPEVHLIGQTVTGGTRTLYLRVRSIRDAAIVALHPGQGAEFLSLTVNGESLPPPAFEHLVYWGVPAEGIDVAVEVTAKEPVTIAVVDHSYGLPKVSFEPRPANRLPTPRGGIPYSDMTLVRKTFTFETVDSILGMI